MLASKFELNGSWGLVDVSFLPGRAKQEATTPAGHSVSWVCLERLECQFYPPGNLLSLYTRAAYKRNNTKGARAGIDPRGPQRELIADLASPRAVLDTLRYSMALACDSQRKPWCL